MNLFIGTHGTPLLEAEADGSPKVACKQCLQIAYLRHLSSEGLHTGCHSSDARHFGDIYSCPRTVTFEGNPLGVCLRKRPCMTGAVRARISIVACDKRTPKHVLGDTWTTEIKNSWFQGEVREIEKCTTTGSWIDAAGGAIAGRTLVVFVTFMPMPRLACNYSTSHQFYNGPKPKGT